MLSEWDYLNGVWRRSLPVVDNREIYEWAADDMILPGCYAVPGRFEISTAPWAKEPMQSLKKPTVREVVAQSGVQCIKTLIGELWLCWLVKNSPGPTQWLQPTDEEASEHFKERFLALLMSSKSLRKYFTGSRHDITDTFVKFLHMYLRLEGVSNKGNLQRKSIKNQMCSEGWQKDKWTPGKLAEAADRLTQFTFNSKRYIESQPGEAGDDMDQKYEAGTKKIWGYDCLGCGKWNYYSWTTYRNDGSRAGMVWEDSPRTKRENGEWRWGELFSTIRHECKHCGHGHIDEPRTRKLMLDNSHYVQHNLEADGKIESYTWNQLTAPNLSWYDRVKKFLLAQQQANRGNPLPLIEFFQKSVGETNDPMRAFKARKIPVINIDSTAGKWVKEHVRIMSIDVQNEGFYFVIRAWARDGESRLLLAGTANTWGELREIQKRLGVYNGCVFVDSGNGVDTDKIYEECSLSGSWEIINGKQKWVCWYATKGAKGEGFPYFDLKGKVKSKIILPYIFPFSKVRGAPMPDGTGFYYCELIVWSNKIIKDITARYRDGKESPWSSYEGAPPEWEEQMKSERPVKVTDKNGFQSWVWQVIGKRANHYWDCENLNTLGALLDLCVKHNEIPADSRDTTEPALVDIPT